MRLPEDFINEMKDIVPKFDDFLNSYNQKPARAFKVNVNKISAADYIALCGQRENVPFAADCFYAIENEIRGTHPYHHAGMIYFQEPSAMSVVNAFDIDADLALDMCAAPGGKTVQLADKVKYLVSNDITPSRALTLKSNVERMGFTNVAITCNDPCEFEKCGQIFDLILVDAPCSGEGMFRKDETAVAQWSKEHSLSCADRQYAILLSADKALRQGGTIIYSTCTFSVAENEGVIERFLQNHDYELVKPSQRITDYTTYLTHPYMRRFYPHLGKGEGQFFAAIRKVEGGSIRRKDSRVKSDYSVAAFVKELTGLSLDCVRYGDNFYIPAMPYALDLRYMSGGVRAGGYVGKTFKPDHYLFSAYGSFMQNAVLDEDAAVKYIKGEQLEGSMKGFGAVTIGGASLGGVKGDGSVLKNLYPKGLRN